MKTYSAEETAQLTALSKATLRYYESEKLIGPIARDAHQYRLYTEQDLEWIKVIKMLRDLGIPVKDLKGVLETSMPERLAGLIKYRQMVQTKIRDLETTDQFLDQKINYMKKLN